MVEEKSNIIDYSKRNIRLINPYYMPYYPGGQLDNEEYERINKKRIQLLISGVIFSLITSWIYIYSKITRDPYESQHGMGEFCFIGAAVAFNLLFWGVVFFAIVKLHDRSRASFYTVLGAFLLAILPGILILGGVLMAGIIWYGYCILIVIVGLKALVITVKEKGIKHILEPSLILFLGIIGIIFLLMLRMDLY
jgi:hypothetical protein